MRMIDEYENEDEGMSIENAHVNLSISKYIQLMDSNQSRDSTYMYILLFFLLFFALLRRVLCVSREDPLNLKGDCSSKQP